MSWSKWPLAVRMIVVIGISCIIATGIFRLIYATNPWMELTQFIMTATMKQDVVGKPAPELQGLESWFNTEQPVTIAQLRGKVVLIDFWTYGCINCQRSVPHIVNWDAKYRDQGLVIIGVHTPEFRFERAPENVAKAINEFGIKYPVALDNDYQTWRAFQNRYWPAVYLIDKNGTVAYKKFGEGEYESTEQKIEELLAE